MANNFSEIALAIAMLVGGLQGCQTLEVQSPLISVPEPANPGIIATNSSSLKAWEQSIHQQVNQYRQSRQLTPLKLDPRISQQARIHSERMAAGTVPFSHEGFKGRIQIIGAEIPYRTAAENVAYNEGYADPATQAVQGWIDSPNHHKNMVGNFNLTGIGVAKNGVGEIYFTQIFILQR